MAQYISKTALVAEIERRRDAALTRQKNLESIGQETVLNEMVANELNRILSFLNSLEVKEVDLDTDFGICWGNYIDYGGNINNYEVAKHFFELGLKAQKGE